MKMQKRRKLPHTLQLTGQVVLPTDKYNISTIITLEAVIISATANRQ